tara:strand:- start:100 stop:348 length:249 start_codon:yes stop_codon:yes gene_type:complete
VKSPSSNQELSEETSSNSDVEKKKKNFFIATYEELKLVVWPNKQQLFSESVAVIIMVSFSAAAIAAVSRFYGWAASQIFQLN